jgi:hypothetical protein
MNTWIKDLLQLPRIESAARLLRSPSAGQVQDFELNEAMIVNSVLKSRLAQTSTPQHEMTGVVLYPTSVAPVAILFNGSEWSDGFRIREHFSQFGTEPAWVGEVNASLGGLKNNYPDIVGGPIVLVALNQDMLGLFTALSLALAFPIWLLFISVKNAAEQCHHVITDRIITEFANSTGMTWVPVEYSDSDADEDDPDRKLYTLERESMRVIALPEDIEEEVKDGSN